MSSDAVYSGTITLSVSDPATSNSTTKSEVVDFHNNYASGSAITNSDIIVTMVPDTEGVVQVISTTKNADSTYSSNKIYTPQSDLATNDTSICGNVYCINLATFDVISKATKKSVPNAVTSLYTSTLSTQTSPAFVIQKEAHQAEVNPTQVASNIFVSTGTSIEKYLVFEQNKVKICNLDSNKNYLNSEVSLILSKGYSTSANPTANTFYFSSSSSTVTNLFTVSDVMLTTMSIVSTEGSATLENVTSTVQFIAVPSVHFACDAPVAQLVLPRGIALANQIKKDIENVDVAASQNTTALAALKTPKTIKVTTNASGSRIISEIATYAPSQKVISGLGTVIAKVPASGSNSNSGSGSGSGSTGGGSASSTPSTSLSYSLEWFAGKGGSGFVNGIGTQAMFSLPRQITINRTNNFIYLADQNNHAIRKISPTGVVNTLAGTGIQGATDGVGSLASFNIPRGIAVDEQSGNVYVADYGNRKIRKITPEGMVSTLAGTGIQGATDGAGSIASFNLPNSIAYDSGFVYTTEINGYVVRKVDVTTGFVSKVAGSGSGYLDNPSSTAQFKNPGGITIDPVTKNIYVTDNSNIRKISAVGSVSTLAGSTTTGFMNGASSTARFNFLNVSELYFDSTSNKLYAADFENNAIRLISSTGSVSTLSYSTSAGSDDGPLASQALFNAPSGIAFDSDGNIFVSDYRNNQIRKINTSLTNVSTFAGLSNSFADQVNSVPVGSAQFNSAYGLAFDASGSNLYVAERSNHSIRKISNGLVSVLAGSSASGYVDATGASARFNSPFGIAIDNLGNIIVSDQWNNKIRKINAQGGVSTVAGPGSGSSAAYINGTGTNAMFRGPLEVAVDSLGNMYVADSNNHAIRKITADGSVSTFAGASVYTTGSYVEGIVTAARFNKPSSVALGKGNDTNIYVADTGNHVIRKITAAGSVSTLAGSGVAGYQDGTGSSAQFNSPMGLAVDALGNVYVADNSNHRIRKITPSGVVTTIAGNGEPQQRYGTYPYNSVRFPSGITIGPDGNLYVTSNGNRIMKVVIGPGG